MDKINIDKLIQTCAILSKRICTIEGHRHSSSWIFDQCMRVFDCKLPAESITFTVYINAPVMDWGEATIYRDGSMQMRTKSQ